MNIECILSIYTNGAHTEKKLYIRLSDKLLYYSANSSNYNSKNNNNNKTNVKLAGPRDKSELNELCLALCLDTLACTHRIPLIAHPNQFMAQIDKAAIRHIE